MLPDARGRCLYKSVSSRLDQGGQKGIYTLLTTLGSPAATRFADLFRRHQREVEASFERAHLSVYTVGTLQQR